MSAPPSLPDELVVRNDSPHSGGTFRVIVVRRGPSVQPGRDEILAAVRHYAGERVPISSHQTGLHG